MEGVAEREVVLLDRDDVGEVGADLECELEAERHTALVPQLEMVLHALADKACPCDRERVLREPRHDRVAEVEGGREVLDRAPLIRSSSRERKRVSSAKKPLVRPSRSPISSQMQKVEPSRIVIVATSLLAEDAGP